MSRTTAVGIPLNSMTCLATGSWPNNGIRYGFDLVEVVNTIRNWLITSTRFMKLLNQFVYIAGKALIVAHRVHSWIISVILFYVLVMYMALSSTIKAFQEE